MKQKRNSRWPMVGAVFLILAIIGFTITISIIRTEGFDGLWRRKRGAIEGVYPGASPSLDKMEPHLPLSR